jgi:hypothetical protein
VFRYATRSGCRSVVPSRRSKEKHHASLTDPKAIGALLRAIDGGYQGSFITESALPGTPHVRAARPAA